MDRSGALHRGCDLSVRGAARAGEIRMTGQGLAQAALYVAVLVALAKPLGAFMAAVYEGRRTFLSPVLQPLERLLYRLGGVDETRETDWKIYTLGLLLFNL